MADEWLRKNNNTKGSSNNNSMLSANSSEFLKKYYSLLNFINLELYVSAITIGALSTSYLSFEEIWRLPPRLNRVVKHRIHQCCLLPAPS